MFGYLGKIKYDDTSKNKKSRLQRLNFLDGDLKLGGLYGHKGKFYKVLVKEYYDVDVSATKPVRVEVYPGFNYKNKEV